MRRSSFLLFATLASGMLIASGCGDNTDAAGRPSASATVHLAPENVITAAEGPISSGPLVSGQLTPAREATVRSQVAGSVMALPVDRGQPVRKGAEVARISSRDLQSNYESAGTQVTSAETALSVAQSEEQRTEALVKGGALAERDLEQAKNAVSSNEAQVAAAKARQRSIWQQLDDTSVKAPFSGIVSSRPANLGDVVTSGTELLTIIDPSSLRLEALVPSDQIEQVKPGVSVHFTIRGISGDFVGTVDRLSPAADPVTRQVSIFITLPNIGGKLISGLFAEGRVETATRDGIIVPLSAVDETGPIPMVTRVRDGKAEHAAVTLGLRQAETEQVEVTKGVSAGDLLVVGSNKAVPQGTPVTIVQ